MKTKKTKTHRIYVKLSDGVWYEATGEVNLGSVKNPTEEIKKIKIVPTEKSGFDDDLKGFTMRFNRGDD